MAKQYTYRIVKEFDKLSERAEEINVFTEEAKVHEVVRALKDTMDIDKSIIGLAAPQIGYNVRIFCIRFKEGIKAFVNPMIVKVNPENWGVFKEIDPSIKSNGEYEEYFTIRSNEIIVSYTTPTKIIQQDILIKDDTARIFQHLDDLLNGILISDLGLLCSGDVWNSFSKEEQEDILVSWVGERLNCQDKIDALNKEIESDELGKKTLDALNFMTKLAKGELCLEHAEDSSKEAPTSNETEIKEETPTDTVKVAKKRKYTRKTKSVETSETKLTSKKKKCANIDKA